MRGLLFDKCQRRDGKFSDRGSLGAAWSAWVLGSINGDFTLFWLSETRLRAVWIHQGGTNSMAELRTQTHSPKPVLATILAQIYRAGLYPQGFGPNWLRELPDNERIL